ncbi:MAG: aldehyde dehydrogenase family protein [Erysipelotrichales bacterium]|nr:aldehyde dehydrogenase family protein [Erysipelotrichales bacterium]
MKLNLAIDNLKDFYHSNQTKPRNFRTKNLTRLLNSIQKNELELLNALSADLSLSAEEAYLTELSYIYRELKYFIRKVKGWMKPTKNKGRRFNYPAKSYSIYESCGISLIVNYTTHFCLNTFSPLISSLAAGNVIFLKLNSNATNTNKVIRAILNETFIDNFIYIASEDTNLSELAAFTFDHIYYAGSQEIALPLLKSPVNLTTPKLTEFSVKTPCIIDKLCDIEKACQKIIWAKTLNAGQSNFTIDYLLVNKYNRFEIIKSLKKYINQFYPDPLNDEHYPKIANEKQFNRLVKILYEGKILHGGKYHSYYAKIEPTIMENVNQNLILKEDVLGPILPIFEYETIEDAIQFVNAKEKPLVTYYFSLNKKNIALVTDQLKTDNIAINETVLPFIDDKLPLAGINNKHLRGFNSFVNFSTAKHIFNKKLYKHDNLRFPPYKGKMKDYRRNLG